MQTTGDIEMEGQSIVVAYTECNRNHTVGNGSFTTDGCVSFMPDLAKPGGLYCDACGCHRSFHKVQIKEIKAPIHPQNVQSDIQGETSQNLIDLTHSESEIPVPLASDNLVQSAGRRKFKRYTPYEIERMKAMANGLSWRMPGNDASFRSELLALCEDMGIRKDMFKSWMHAYKRRVHKFP